MLISPSDYDSAVEKGVAQLLLDFDEDGFFERVDIAFPFTRKTRTIRLNDTQNVLEFGLDLSRWPRLAWVLRRALAPLQAIWVVASLAKHMHATKADVVRATDPCYSGLLGWAVARLSRRPFCVSIHTDYDKRLDLDAVGGAPRLFGSRGLTNLIEQFVLRRADMVLPIRESLIPYVERRGATRRRIRVIPHGADLTPFLTRQDADTGDLLDLPPGTQLISFVGRLSKENYLDEILDAIEKAAARRSDFQVLIVGGGSDEERLRARVAAAPKLSSTVQFTGFLDRSKVGAVRQSSLISLCLMGGFSLIEACAAGSAVIAYDIEWHHELVIPEETGILLEDHDVAGVAAAIDMLLSDPEKAQRLGAAARQLAVARHSIEVATATKRRYYIELIEEAASGRV